MLHKKSDQVAQGKKTIAMLIEQITDYQQLMEQEKEALANDLRRERATRDDLEAKLVEARSLAAVIQDDLEAEQAASRQQSQDTMNNLRTLMMELEMIEEANATLNQKLLDEREAHQASLRLMQEQSAANAAASATTATAASSPANAAAAAVDATAAAAAAATASAASAAGRKSDSSVSHDDSSGALGTAVAVAAPAPAVAAAVSTPTSSAAAAPASKEKTSMKKRSGAGDPSAAKRDSRDGRAADGAKSSIKRVSLGGVDDSDDEEFDNSDGPSDKPTRRRSKPHTGASHDRLFQSMGAAAGAPSQQQQPQANSGGLAASAALASESRGSYTSRGRRANNATPEPPSSLGGSPTNSRRSSPTRGSGAQPRRRHRTHTDADSMALPDFGDLGDARIDDSPADADEAFQLRRTITYLTHQLAAVRDMVGETIDAVQASPMGTVRPLVTPRSRGTRRVASGSSSSSTAATTSAAPPLVRSSAAMTSSTALLDSNRSAMRTLRSKLEEQIKIESVRGTRRTRERGSDSAAAAAQPAGSPLLTKQKSWTAHQAAAAGPGAAALAATSASLPTLNLPGSAAAAPIAVAAKAKNAPNVKANRERVFAAPAGVTALGMHDGNVWAGCEDGSIVVFNSKTRALVAHAVAYVPLEHNGGADKAQAARSVPLGAAPPPAMASASAGAVVPLRPLLVSVVSLAVLPDVVWAAVPRRQRGGVEREAVQAGASAHGDVARHAPARRREQLRVGPLERHEDSRVARVVAPAAQGDCAQQLLPGALLRRRHGVDRHRAAHSALQRAQPRARRPARGATRRSSRR
jgi:hypothetical protein